MQSHIKIYFDFFDYNPFEPILCEKCGAKAVDIHHIYGRGKDKNVIGNLMALCRECHEIAHDSNNKSEMQAIHDKFMKRC